MPRRAAALATPATSTPLTDPIHNPQLDDPFAAEVSLLRRQWKWAAFSQFFYTFATLFAMPDVSLTVSPPFSFSPKSRPLARLVPPSPRHSSSSTHAYSPLGHRGRFDAVYIHRHSPSNASLTCDSHPGSKTFVRLVHSLACCTPLISYDLSGWRTGKHPCESSTRNVILISTRLVQNPLSNSPPRHQTPPPALTLMDPRQSPYLHRGLLRVIY